MTWIAPAGLFAGLLVVAVAGAALAAVVLGVLIVRDAVRGKLW